MDDYLNNIAFAFPDLNLRLRAKTHPSGCFWIDLEVINLQYVYCYFRYAGNHSTNLANMLYKLSNDTKKSYRMAVEPVNLKTLRSSILESLVRLCLTEIHWPNEAELHQAKSSSYYG